MVCLKEGGTLQRPHIRQPCSTESSCLRVKYGLRSVSAQWLTGQPFCVSNTAFANKGFLDVSLAISAAESGCRFNCWEATWKISSSTFASFLYWSGSLDKASALATLADDLNSISYWYEERRRNQRCSLAAAKTGVAESGENIFSRGLWSVRRVNLRPKRHM